MIKKNPKHSGFLYKLTLFIGQDVKIEQTSWPLKEIGFTQPLTRIAAIIHVS